MAILEAQLQKLLELNLILATLIAKDQRAGGNLLKYCTPCQNKLAISNNKARKGTPNVLRLRFVFTVLHSSVSKDIWHAVLHIHTRRSLSVESQRTCYVNLGET